MQNPTRPAHRLDALLEPSFWNRNRGWILGSIVLAAIILGVALFFQDFGAQRDEKAWQAMTAGDFPGQLRDEVPLDEVEGTSAEPWALLQNARHAYDEDRLQDAADLVARLRSEFPDHMATQSPVLQSLAEQLDAEQRWRAEHPRTEITNPEVQAPRSVVLHTDLGDVRIGLYLDEAPVATREFLRLVRSGRLATARFDETTFEGSLLLSVPKTKAGESASEEEAAENEETSEEVTPEPAPLVRGIVPDRNLLSPVRGAVTFYRPRPGSIAPDAGPRIALYLEDAPTRQGEEVVFGTVIEGLELLDTIAERETEEGSSRLKESVAVTGAEEGEELGAISVD